MTINEGVPLPFGVTAFPDLKRIMFSVWAKDETKCELQLYRAGKRIKSIPMYSMEKMGARDVFSVCLEGEEIIDEVGALEYTFKAGKCEFVDPYAKRIVGRERFASKGRVRGAFSFDSFDWTGENRRELAFSEMVLYQCHVRGFTKHSSSNVSEPGCFSGVVEKIPYLKDLGINTLLLMPIYDFNEIQEHKDGRKIVNYWGYTKDAFYFSPKESFTVNGKNPVTELKAMVKALHQNEMNLILDMHFQDKTKDFILDCLRYYVTEFHVDGFLVNQDIVSAELIMNDPILRNVKLLGTGWPACKEAKRKARLAAFNDGFMVDARRFLKSDEGMTSSFYQRFRNQGGDQGIINYLTQKNGFTMKDLVSYDIKHNEANGEKNQDGTEYNYSWNCGAEGTTRRKSVLTMRRQQLKNGFAFLLLSLGTPMILAGDEFANSQKGNNNAYCQDNATTWLDWRLLDKNKDLFSYVKLLIEFRRKCDIYSGRILNGIDSRGVGAPDISCHGIEPWMNEFANYSRELGVMFYKSYFEQDTSYYYAFNMHWEPHEFYLPVIDQNSSWEVIFDTSREKKVLNEKEMKYVMDPRTICVFREIPGPQSKN